MAKKDLSKGRSNVDKLFKKTLVTESVETNINDIKDIDNINNTNNINNINNINSIDNITNMSNINDMSNISNVSDRNNITETKKSKKQKIYTEQMPLYLTPEMKKHISDSAWKNRLKEQEYVRSLIEKDIKENPLN